LVGVANSVPQPLISLQTVKQQADRLDSQARMKFMRKNQIGRKKAAFDDFLARRPIQAAKR
jgi:hypothetical protein